MATALACPGRDDQESRGMGGGSALPPSPSHLEKQLEGQLHASMVLVGTALFDPCTRRRIAKVGLGWHRPIQSKCKPQSKLDVTIVRSPRDLLA
jgi:hypothetical protein